MCQYQAMKMNIPGDMRSHISRDMVTNMPLQFTNIGFKWVLFVLVNIFCSFFIFILFYGFGCRYALGFSWKYFFHHLNCEFL